MKKNSKKKTTSTTKSKKIEKDKLRPEKFGPYNIHNKQDCELPCPFHGPSEHPLKNATIHIRFDKSFLVERICRHGVGHDDPDSVKYMKKHGHDWAGVHGCDGCCKVNNRKKGHGKVEKGIF